MLKRSAAAVAAVLALSLLAACGGDDEPDAAPTATDAPTETPTDETPSPEPTEEPTADGACVYEESGDPAREVDAPPAEPAETENVEVTLQTDQGDIPMTLLAESAPCTVNSFLSLADQGFYDDTPCPRIAASPGFGILQCGDPSGTTAGGPGYRFDDELTGEETYPAGTLAMANAGPNTNGSQFFLVYVDTQLPPSYTVFGTFTDEGIAVVEAVAAEGDDGSNPAGGGAPNQPINILGVQR